jgi:hypothetical protein
LDLFPSQCGNRRWRFAAARYTPPSKVIFLALAACVLVYCLFEFAKVHFRFPLVAGVFLLLLIGAFVPKFKYKFLDLEQYYETWSPNQPKHSAEQPGLLDPKATLEAWLRQQQRVSSDPPKLVVVATSGGAYRATFWTAVVLDKLSTEARLPNFAGSIRLMTGASGGMVGAAYFAVPAPTGSSPSLKARLQSELRERGKKIWLTNSKADSLTPVVQRMIGLDLIRVFLPYTNPYDRGQILQDEWQSLQLEFPGLPGRFPTISYHQPLSRGFW